MLEFGDKIEGIEYRDRLGVYALILNDDKLMAVINRRGSYFLPGGGVEGTESHEECLKRECVEELGYNIKVMEYIGKASSHEFAFKTKEYIRLIGDFYTAELIDDNCTKIEEDHKLIWVDPRDVVDKMQVKCQSWAIEKFKDQIKSVL